MEDEQQMENIDSERSLVECREKEAFEMSSGNKPL